MSDGPAHYRAVELAPDESPVGRAFASVAHYSGDLALLNYLLQDLRVLIRRACKSEIPLAPQQVISWAVHGLQRRTVVCDPGGLRGDAMVQIVGFFGDRRAVINETSLELSERGLIDEFVNYPGILSYSSIELVDNYWANLVVHRQPADREAWRHSMTHIKAVNEVAPHVYHGVRIHNGCIPGGIVGSGTVTIESTKYWDYDTVDDNDGDGDCDDDSGGQVWHAVRPIPGGATRVKNGVMAR